VKASGVTLAGLIACSDAGRWPVQREFKPPPAKALPGT